MMNLGDNFVTGDNIYLRELQNFFFEVLGMMSITHYGAIGDGRTDNYGPLQVAIDDAKRRGLNYLYVPYGRFIYTGELTNLYDPETGEQTITFMGNPHSKIVNIRTGVEIPVLQFGIGGGTGTANVKLLTQNTVLTNGVDLETGLYNAGDYALYIVSATLDNLIAGPTEDFYVNKEGNFITTPFKTLVYEDDEWRILQNNNIENELTDSRGKIPTSHAVFEAIRGGGGGTMNAMTAYLTPTSTQMTTISVKLPFDESVSFGTGFTLNNGEIVIGPGITKIMVTGQVRFVTSTAGNTIDVDIHRYSTVTTSKAVCTGEWCFTGEGENTATLAPCLIDVSEGDKIRMFVVAEGEYVGGSQSTPTTYLSVVDMTSVGGGGGSGDYVEKAGDTMSGSLAIGATNTAGNSGVTVAQGVNCEASGYCASAFGYGNKATNNHAHAEGYNATASGWASHAEGRITTASGANAHAEGNTTTASNSSAHAEGYNSTASGQSSHAEGEATLASANQSHAGGYYSTADGRVSFAHGQRVTASRGTQVVFGISNIVETGDPTTIGNASGALIVGNGDVDNEDPSNAMKLTRAGDLYIAGSVTPNGADYAESVEWADGNPNDEDRIGKFAVLENNKMRLATSQDSKELMGVISARPTILGDAFDSYWHGKYVTDAYGRIQYETKEYPEVKDEEGNIIQPAFTQEVPVISQEFDATREYVSRRERKEYDCFAMLGKLIVEDDGTCEAGSYCYPNDNGIATRKYEGFYVLERIDSNHIRIYVK